MKEERMFILNLLKEGTINADETCRLLAALGGEKSENELGEKVSDCASQIKKKVSAIADNARPKVKKYAEAVGEKLDNIKTELKSKKSFTKPANDIIIDEVTESGHENIIVIEPSENDEN